MLKLNVHRREVQAVSKLDHDYSKAHFTFCGFSAVDKNLIEKFADLGVYPRTTFEDAPTFRY